MKKLAWIAAGILFSAFPLIAQQSQPSEEVTPPEQQSSVQGVDLNNLKGDSLGESTGRFHDKTPQAPVQGQGQRVERLPRLGRCIHRRSFRPRS